MKKTLLFILCLSIMATLSFSFAEANIFQIPEIDLSGVNAAIQNVANQEKCKGIRTKIGNKYSSVKLAGDQSYNKFNEVSANIDELVAKASEKGYNTTKIKQDSETFKYHINEYHTKYVYASNLLKIAAMFAGCSNAPLQDINTFKTTISTARNSIKESKNLLKDAKSYYRDVIRQDINVLSQQKYKEQ
jgi:hypothetical protein